MHWPQDTMTEKTFITKDTLFAARELFGFFLLDLSPVLGHGFSGLTGSGKEVGCQAEKSGGN